MINDERGPFGNGNGAPPSGANSGAATTPNGLPLATPADQTMPNPLQSRTQNPDMTTPSIDDIISQIGANLPQRPNGSQSTIDPASVRPGGPVDLRPPGKASTVAASAVGRDQQAKPWKNLK